MSIRLRLTLLYLAVLAVTLLTFGIVLYFQLNRSLRTEIDRSLQVRAERDYLVLSRSSDQPGVAPRRPIGLNDLFAGAPLGDPTIVVQVIDSQGRIVRSPTQGDESLPVPRRLDEAHFETVALHNVPLRVYVRPLPATANGARLFAGYTPPFSEELARSLADVDSTLERVRFFLLIGSFAALGFAGVAGWMLARGALHPIDRLTAEASDIGRRQDFTRRVGHDGPDDEVGRLAATFNGMLDSLAGAHDRVQRALDAQRRFVADASHELRTPLTTIRGNVELLALEHNGENGDQLEALEDIASEAERMSRLVNNLLALARADGGMHITRRQVALQPVVNEVVQKAHRLAERVDLRVEGSADAVVLGDHDHLTQLFFILLDNAIKYTPTGGVVTVSCSRAGDAACISISDTGEGIAERDLSRIFDRFYRADPSRHGDGTGLGLAIARWIVDELRGRIEVQSEVGKGSRFSVILPTAAEAPPHDPSRPELAFTA